MLVLVIAFLPDAGRSFIMFRYRLLCYIGNRFFLVGMNNYSWLMNIDFV